MIGQFLGRLINMHANVLSAHAHMKMLNLFSSFLVMLNVCTVPIQLFSGDLKIISNISFYFLGYVYYVYDGYIINK